MGSTSVFLATEDLPRVHCSETAFRTFLLHGLLLYEPPYDQTNKMTSAPSEDSDQPGHPPSRIRVFAVRRKKHWVLSYPLCNILAIYCYIVHFLISIIYMFSYLLISFSLSPLPILLRSICNMLILISI